MTTQPAFASLQGCSKLCIPQRPLQRAGRTDHLVRRLPPAAVDTTDRHHQNFWACRDSREGRSYEGGQATVDSTQQQQRQYRPPPPPPPLPRSTDKVGRSLGVQQLLELVSCETESRLLDLCSKDTQSDQEHAHADWTMVHPPNCCGRHSADHRLVVFRAECVALFCVPAHSQCCHTLLTLLMVLRPAPRHPDRSVWGAVCHYRSREQGECHTPAVYGFVSL